MSTVPIDQPLPLPNNQQITKPYRFQITQPYHFQNPNPDGQPVADGRIFREFSIHCLVRFSGLGFVDRFFTFFHVPNAGTERRDSQVGFDCTDRSI
jgi:hypothetical protein